MCAAAPAAQPHHAATPIIDSPTAAVYRTGKLEARQHYSQRGAHVARQAGPNKRMAWPGDFRCRPASTLGCPSLSPRERGAEGNPFIWPFPRLFFWRWWCSMPHLYSHTLLLPLFPATGSRKNFTWTGSPYRRTASKETGTRHSRWAYREAHVASHLDVLLFHRSHLDFAFPPDWSSNLSYARCATRRHGQAVTQCHGYYVTRRGYVTDK